MIFLYAGWVKRSVLCQSGFEGTTVRENSIVEKEMVSEDVYAVIFPETSSLEYVTYIFVDELPCVGEGTVFWEAYKGNRGIKLQIDKQDFSKGEEAYIITFPVGEEWKDGCFVECSEIYKIIH